MTFLLNRGVYPRVLILGIAIMLMAVLSITGCATNGSAPTASEDVGEVILKPGDSKTCISTPCTVWFQMPEGSGTYALWQNNQVKLGDYPAGEKVQIGNFWSNNYFNIPDSDFPKAHLFVVGR